MHTHENLVVPALEQVLLAFFEVVLFISSTVSLCKEAIEKGGRCTLRTRVVAVRASVPVGICSVLYTYQPFFSLFPVSLRSCYL